MRLDLFLLGGVEYRTDEREGTALFEALRAGGFSPKGTKRCEKTGEIVFSLFLWEARRFDRLVAARGAPHTRRRPFGTPKMFFELSSRPGIIVGALLGILLFVAAHLFVWEVKIEGGERLTATEVESELAEAGLYRGAFLPRVDREAVAFALRRADTRIGYAAVNLVGTVAKVQIRESEPEPITLSTAPANLVAARDGVVTLPLAFRGECLVREGEAVREGQLLVSGLVDTEAHGTRLLRATGQILARTSDTYEEFVPFDDEERCQTGREKREVSLLFFSRVLKLFKNTGKMGEDCDIIENIQWLTTPSGKRLPIGFCVTSVREAARASVRRSVSEARSLALERAEERLAADCEGRTLLYRTTTTEVSDAGVRLWLVAVCEEDIARVVELAAE